MGSGKATLAVLEAIAVTALGLAACGDDGSVGVAPDEPRLDGSVPAARDQEQQLEKGQAPRAVELVTPGGRKQKRSKVDEEEPSPPGVVRENAQIRQELDHLKALSTERRRVSLALGAASASYDGPLQLGAGGLAWPIRGAVVSPFGQRWGRLHAGIDIASPAGTVIRAAETGQVVISGPTGGYGNYVCVQHTKRLTTCYAHLSRFLTEKGTAVRQGEPLGLVGCTGHCFGDHLHFETWVSGRPVDPMNYL